MKTNCEHQCSGRCRREGCNCACGEWHGDTDEQDDIQENTDSMEEKLENLTSDTIAQHSVPNNHPRNFNVNCEHLYKQTWRFDNKVEYTCLKCDDWLKLVLGNEVLCRRCGGLYVYDKQQQVFYCNSCNGLPYQEELDQIKGFQSEKSLL